MTRRRLSVLVAAGVGLGAAALAGSSYAADLKAARARLTGTSRTIATRSGRLEYAVAGEGNPLLMIHGTGGGFDQGQLFARALGERGYRIIAPSRFGYLRSELPADPAPAAQADAFVELLDRLAIDRIAVAGGSAGALSAMQFAVRHPDRCAALILLVPAANLDGRDPVAMTNVQKRLYEASLGSDFLYWAMLRSAPRWLIGTLLATDPALVAAAPANEGERVRNILETMFPISRRARGMIADGRAAGRYEPVPLERIGAPTLIISAEDDRFGTAATARAIAERLPSARLLVLPDGGHVWVGHDAKVADTIDTFLKAAR